LIVSEAKPEDALRLSDLYNQLVNNPAIEVGPDQIQTLYDDERDLNTTFGVNMGHYIDGFVLPVPCDCLNEYRRLAETVAKIWQEHGALDYREYSNSRVRSCFLRLVSALIQWQKARHDPEGDIGY
jgi:hypothetical protein